MPKRSINQAENAAAFRLVRLATGQEVFVEPGQATPKPKPKDLAAVQLGRRGGLKGGPARAAKLSKKKLSEIGKKGARARWGKTRS